MEKSEGSSFEHMLLIDLCCSFIKAVREKTKCKLEIRKFRYSHAPGKMLKVENKCEAAVAYCCDEADRDMEPIKSSLKVFVQSRDCSRSYNP